MIDFELEFENWLMYLGSIEIFMLIGYWILTFKIINDYDIKNKFAIVLFCSIFSFSVNCMALILFEIWKIGDEFSRLVKWKITLSFLVYSTLFLIPSILIYKIVKRFKI